MLLFFKTKIRQSYRHPSYRHPSYRHPSDRHPRYLSLENLPEKKIIPTEAVVMINAHARTDIASSLDLPTG